MSRQVWGTSISSPTGAAGRPGEAKAVAPFVSQHAKLFVIGIFTLTYLMVILFYSRKTIIVWAAVAVLLILDLLTLGEAWEAVELNVLFLYFGMLFVSESFLLSRMPDFLAVRVAGKAKTTGAAMVIICAFTGLLSIMLENVAVVLLVAPIALAISRKAGIHPVPLFIGIAVSSNLQGAATLIGDPPSMLLAGATGFTFNDFFFFDGRPGIFFATEIGAVVATLVLLLLFRRYQKPMPILKREHLLTFTPTLLVLALIVSLILGSSYQQHFRYMTGLICLFFGVLSFIWYLLHSRGRGLKEYFFRLDWQTGLFLAGIFILVESLSAAGLMEDLASFILRISRGSPLVVYLVIVWFSVILSAFVDNVPYLMAMLPVVGVLTAELGVSAYLLYLGLLLGASVGGNITPLGASANIVAMGIMRKQGHSVNFFEFVRIGLPFTVFAVLASTFFAWLFFA
jgi:Na+/H+ antiporter NhaD/arsenite permease-like protein